MKHFSSYGPVDCEEHFCVSRKDLVKRCIDQIIGKPEKSGHYFTIWAPRQTGKTWLMRQVKMEIENHYSDRFIIGSMSVQGVMLKEDDPDETFLKKVPQLMKETFRLEIESPVDWEGFKDLFYINHGLFDRPVILFIDEFDSLPPKVIDRLVTLFRDMYLKPDSYILHGLAIIGVRAVLGVESLRGSPFNIQRSLHVPNLTKNEVEDLFSQYREESDREIEPVVVEKVYEVTRGQPGLVSWFGELLTEKYNPGSGRILNNSYWEEVYENACHVEFNNTVLNIIKKAKGAYRSHVLDMFSRSDMRFSLDTDWCNYLYLHGVIDQEKIEEPSGRKVTVCRFASPFIQLRIYNALTYDLIGDRLPILALEPLDELSDVFEKEYLDIPALLKRYKDYLERLKVRGINPWKDQPRRTDLHPTEAVGHFHLYAWLQNAVGRRCAISPEFPTGNGKVDLHLNCGKKQGIIEVKSFIDALQVKEAGMQAARYAGQMGLDAVTVALFVPVDDDEVIKRLSGEKMIEGVMVTVSAIGWM